MENWQLVLCVLGAYVLGIIMGILLKGLIDNK